jgi:hypothetical protein
MHLPKPTPAEDPTGPDLARSLSNLGYHLRDCLNRHDWDVLSEAARRLKQHEQLLREVVLDLRNRVNQLEEALARLVPPG